MSNFFDNFFGKSEPIKIYTEEELNQLNVNELKEIVNLVELRNPLNKSFHSFSSPKIHAALSFSYKILGNRFENSIEKQKYISQFEYDKKKAKLELDAEEISINEYENKIELLKKQLIKTVWDISNTPEEIVNKLFELELISIKQKDICLSNKNSNDEMKNKNEKMLDKEFYYVDYIIKHQ
jgi:hypothetical protein